MTLNLVKVRGPRIELTMTEQCPDHWMNVIINGKCPMVQNHQGKRYLAPKKPLIVDDGKIPF